MVPPGAPHTFANVTDDPAVMLKAFTPGLCSTFCDLKAKVKSGQPLFHDSVAEVWTKHDTEPSTEYLSCSDGTDSRGAGVLGGSSGRLHAMPNGWRGHRGYVRAGLFRAAPDSVLSVDACQQVRVVSPF
ncbi:hypothetical protein a10_08378 [Streptomyces acidiscabies]|nr:hypothetical protein a10_08378 [Streptomyces acidiscabies]GAV45613.1 hypothetical protein Saa2_08604 [Streptomyces acidiscabies]